MPRSPRAAHLVALVGAAAVIAPASAGAATIDGGTVTVTPKGAAARTLERAGVAISASGGATAANGAVTLPVVGGRTAKVTLVDLAPSAGLQLRGRGASVALTDLQLKLGRSSLLRGRIDGGARRTLFHLKATRLYPDAAGRTATRTSLSLRLVAGAVRSLREELGLPGLRATTFGRATVGVTLAAPAPVDPGPTVPTTPTTPTVPTTPTTPTDPGPTLTGTADWGLKASFRNYIGSPIAHGTITVGDGATTNPDGTFRFGAPEGSFDPASGAIDARYGGSVHFEGHAGLLQMSVRKPRVVLEAGATSGTLYVDASSKSLATGEVVDYPNVAFATLDFAQGTKSGSGDTVTWTGVPATLTDEGAPAFAGFYGAGTVLDPISFSLSNE